MTRAVGEQASAVRLIASPSGTQVALVEPGRIAVLSVPDLMPIAEVGIDGGLDTNDVEFSGERLVVMSRVGVLATLHIVDPTGPTKVGEIPYRVATRIAAVAGELVMTTGGGTTMIVDTSKVAASPLPLRSAITASGRLGPDRFVVAAGGVIEEWDGHRRAPGRRLRLDKPIDLTHVGGNGLRIWMINRDEPTRLDVITLATRSTRRFDLPEEPARISVHERGDLLAIVGATTGTPIVLDLTRASPFVRFECGPVVDVAWLGHARTLVVQPVSGPTVLMPVPLTGDQYEAPVASEPPPTADDGEPTTPREVRVVTQETEQPPTSWSREDISSRLASWRDRHQAAAPDEAPPELDPDAQLTPAVARSASNARDRGHPGGWRGELAAWARAVCARSYREAARIDRGVLDELTTRLELTEIPHALALLYGAHLAGTPVSAFDLASVVAWRWDEALGGGRLAATGAVRWRKDRIELIDEARAVLDELPALTGSIIDGPSAADATVAIVAPAEIDAARVGAFAAPSIGALLVPNRRGIRRPARFLLEARLRGLAPLVPWLQFRDALGVPPPRGAIVVDHATTAANLDLPVVATWTSATVDRD